MTHLRLDERFIGIAHTETLFRRCYTNENIAKTGCNNEALGDTSLQPSADRKTFFRSAVSSCLTEIFCVFSKAIRTPSSLSANPRSARA